MPNRYFIAVYTNQVKDYCDEVFFSNLYKVSRGEPVFIIDNTAGDSYYRKLQNMFAQHGYSNFNLQHLNVPELPRESGFQRNVCSSVNYLRGIYLDQTDLPYFLIIESDIYSPPDLLDKFDACIEKLNTTQPQWGIAGGLYYEGFHNYNFNTANTTLEKTGHCLSGCTVYKRELITKYPFRYNASELRNFPDAYISFDSSKEYTLWNEHRIKCDHLHNPSTGGRTSCGNKMEIPYLMPHQMEAFNGDTFIEKEFLKLRDQFNIDTVIETGTCFGSTTKFLGKHFAHVISIEINRHYLDIARSLMGATNNIDTYCGASQHVLPEIIKPDWKDKNLLFFLDANWAEPCPLQDELRIIAEHGLQPVIAIHDFQVPGQPLAFDSYKGQPFTFQWLKPYFDRIYGEHGYEHYYNTAETATEIKVGIIYITPRKKSVRLFTNYYVDVNPSRQKEIVECISRNVENAMIDKVYLIANENDANFPLQNNNKIEVIIHSGRPTFAELFSLANSENEGNDISILANTDIYFTEHDISLVKSSLDHRGCFALSRWDRSSDGSIELFDRADSQDSWIFCGLIKPVSNCDFTMGRPGCDNAICQRIEAAGYAVQNPARDIRSIHVHRSGIRNYIAGDWLQTVPQPYKLVAPHNLSRVVTSIPSKKSIALYLISGDTAPNFVIRNAFQEHFEVCEDFDWINIAWQTGLHAMHRQFIEKLKMHRPDYCFMQVQDPSKMDVSTIREMAKYTKIINWTGDVRNSAGWYNWLADIGREVHLTLFTNETDVEKLRSRGVRADYLQIGFDDVYYQKRTRIEGWPDIVFAAHEYDAFDLSEYRRKVVFAMYEAFPGRFRVFGDNWHRWGINTESLGHTMEAECYNSCKIALSVSNYNYNRYHSDRLLRIMGCGAFALSHSYPFLEKDYTPGYDLDIFSNIDELIEKCNYYLVNEEERNEIASNAFITAHTKCTWNKRCIELKNLLGMPERRVAKINVPVT